MIVLAWIIMYLKLHYTNFQRRIRSSSKEYYDMNREGGFVGNDFKLQIQMFN